MTRRHFFGNCLPLAIWIGVLPSALGCVGGPLRPPKSSELQSALAAPVPLHRPPSAADKPAHGWVVVWPQFLLRKMGPTLLTPVVREGGSLSPLPLPPVLVSPSFPTGATVEPFFLERLQRQKMYVLKNRAFGGSGGRVCDIPFSALSLPGRRFPCHARRRPSSSAFALWEPGNRVKSEGIAVRWPPSG